MKITCYKDQCPKKKKKKKIKERERKREMLFTGRTSLITFTISLFLQKKVQKL